MKRIICTALCVFMAAGIFCACSRENNESSKLAATHMAGGSALDEVCAALKDAGLANVDIYKERVSEFNSTVGKAGKLTEGWVDPDELGADIFACMDAWEEAFDFSDADCRMTALLLLDGVISAQRLENDYDGTYLMFDLDAAEQTDRYDYVKRNMALFTTLFGEHDGKSGEAAKNIFPRLWREHSFHIDSDKASLISVVLPGDYEGQVFTGHTGVLVDCGDHLLFVEKIAFEQPYQATKLSDTDALIKLLSARPEYFAGGEGTFVYRDGVLLAELEPAFEE